MIEAAEGVTVPGMGEQRMPHHDNEEQLLALRARLISQALKGSSPHLPDPAPVAAPLAQALLLRGIASWPDDGAFSELERILPQRRVRVLRYTYHPAGERDYEPLHTVATLKHHSDGLATQLRRTDPALPVDLIAHSLGGLVVTYWLCRAEQEPDHAELRRKIRHIIYLASPIKPIRDFIRIPFHSGGIEVLSISLSDYVERLGLLLERCRDLRVCYLPDDRMALPRETGLAEIFGAESLQALPAREISISAKDHFSFCNDPDVVATVLDWLDV